jgi:N-acyl-D-amino-acid deacylase
MFDLVVRGACIVDGTGAERRSGDVAVQDGRFVEVGGRVGPGKREIQAHGALLTPGWVDIHTHYDGQATWDPLLKPSSIHGVTTLLFGNCGVGFAPARPEHREALVELMEGVEDIPGSALVEGLEWDWETFPEYLDALARRDRVLDIGAQVPHHALRVYAMGERAIRHERANAKDIQMMAQLTEQALRAGAFGFTTSRTDQHKTVAGAMVPGRYSEAEELLGIGRALGAAKSGAFGLISDFEDEQAEFKWLTELGRQSGRPVWFLLTDRASDPQRFRRLLEGVKQARNDGAEMFAQVAGRPIGLILGLQASLNPFSIRPAFRELQDLSPEERLRKLRTPEVRDAIVNGEVAEDLLRVLPPLTQQIATRWDRMYLLGDPPNYEPEYERSVAAIAEREGRSPSAVAYEHLVGGDGTQSFFFPVTGYVTGDHEPIREMLTDPVTLLGLSDGGAHCGVICDASLPTFMLTHWVRDRSRGDRLPLEWVVKRMTQDTAQFFGLGDRGNVAPGLRADFNLIDFDGLRLHAPKIIYDLPAGGKRLMQTADGYLHTFARGIETFSGGEETGARPGQLVRSGD